MDFYAIFNTIATIMVPVYNLLHYQEKKLLLGGVSCAGIKYFESKQRRGIFRILSTIGFWTILETLIISYVQYNATGFFNVQLGNLLDTGSNYFGNIFSAPLLVAAACALLKIDFLAQMDLITPAYPLALFFSKLGCYAAGCCRGIPWEHGFYNPISRMIEFPAQLLEAGVALLLFIFLLCVKRKLKKGTVFPVYLILFSGIRFFTEYLRCEPNVFLGLKTYQLLCLAGVLIGVLEYIAAGKYRVRVQGKKENDSIRR